MPLSSKTITTIATIGLMVIIPVAMFVIAAIIPSFYSGRSQLIKEYNNRAAFWNDNGIEEFKGASFLARVGESQSFLDPYDKTFGQNYPIRDPCNKIGDPQGGCVHTGAYYYSADLKYEGEEVVVTVLNGKSGIPVINATYPTSKMSGKTFDVMGCDSEETCKPICDALGGEIPSGGRVCLFKVYLNEVCYRVAKTGDYDYVLDVPPAWSLYPDTIMPGCDYDLSWNPDYYTPGERSIVKVTVRNYRDSYIQASSFTMGCSSKTEEETACFPENATQDVKVNTICGYLKISAVLLAFIEILVGKEERKSKYEMRWELMIILVLEMQKISICYVSCRACKRCKENNKANMVRLV